jgi:acyl dehydratase
MKFIRPVYAGETITAWAAVTAETKHEEGKRLELEIWVENATGKMTTAGWASARVSVR